VKIRGGGSLNPRVQAQPSSNGSSGGRTLTKKSGGTAALFLGFQRGKYGGDVGAFIGGFSGKGATNSGEIELFSWADRRTYASWTHVQR
jgi:hypothetical protein